MDILEQRPVFLSGVCTANRGYLIHYPEKNGVRLLNATIVKEVEPGSVHISRNIGKNVPNPHNTWQPLLPENIHNPLAKKIKDERKLETLDCGLVVAATGGKADDRLFYELIKSRVAPEIYNIGDSFSAGRIPETIRAAYQLALKI